MAQTGEADCRSVFILIFWNNEYNYLMFLPNSLKFKVSKNFPGLKAKSIFHTRPKDHHFSIIIISLNESDN